MEVRRRVTAEVGEGVDCYEGAMHSLRGEATGEGLAADAGRVVALAIAAASIGGTMAEASAVDVEAGGAAAEIAQTDWQAMQRTMLTIDASAR